MHIVMNKAMVNVRWVRKIKNRLQETKTLYTNIDFHLLIVPFADTCTKPDAVMVKLGYAVVTDVTMRAA